MSSFWNFAFAVVLIIVWLVAGVYVTISSIDLTSYRDKDEFLHRAYWFCFWAAFVTWFLIAIFIILVILAIVGVVVLFGSGAGEAALAEGSLAEGAESAKMLESFNSLSLEQQNSLMSGLPWLLIGFLFFALVLVGITGILSAIAASSMVKSPNYNPDDPKLYAAYNNCIISACISLGAAGLLIIGTITYFIIGWVRAEKIKKLKEMSEKISQEQLKQATQLKYKALESTREPVPKVLEPVPKALEPVPKALEPVPKALEPVPVIVSTEVPIKSTNIDKLKSLMESDKFKSIVNSDSFKSLTATIQEAIIKQITTI